MFSLGKVQKIGTAIVQRVSVSMMANLMRRRLGNQSMHGKGMTNMIFGVGGTRIPRAVVFHGVPGEGFDLGQINLVDESGAAVTEWDLNSHEIKILFFPQVP